MSSRELLAAVPLRGRHLTGELNVPQICLQESAFEMRSLLISFTVQIPGGCCVRLVVNDSTAVTNDAKCFGVITRVPSGTTTPDALRVAGVTRKGVGGSVGYEFSNHLML